MDHVFARSDAQLVEKSNPKAGPTVVDATFGVERYERVVIDITRIGIGRSPIATHAHRALDLPRPGSNKALAGHRREGVNDRALLDMSREAQFFGVAAAGRFH